MTLADKYLKDGVDGIAPLLSEFRNIGAIDSGREYRIDQLLRAKVKPTLTEDEKVILRNMPTYDLIGRADSKLLYVQYKDCCKCGIAPFNHLFQFIKPRRKI